MGESSASAAVVARDLQVARDGKIILHDITCAITAGQITGLIGPSGSGKTTFMRAIVGAQTITNGAVDVLGMPAGVKQLRRRIGYVTQSPAMYNDLTVYQNIAYFATILGCSKAAITEVLSYVDLTAQATQLAGSLSGGQQARVSLAIALLGDAELLILDEPTVGLDPLLRKQLWALFARLADEGRTLLISSHVMDEAEQCPQLLLLREGTVLRAGTKQSLLADTHTKTVGEAFITLIEDANRKAAK
ncbi:MAG: ABC transporter ATP-binding protein [Candidatus Saccharibacteria bacterium]